jgi:hypothetical protein
MVVVGMFLNRPLWVDAPSYDTVLGCNLTACHDDYCKQYLWDEEKKQKFYGMLTSFISWESIVDISAFHPYISSDIENTFLSIRMRTYDDPSTAGEILLSIGSGIPIGNFLLIYV